MAKKIPMRRCLATNEQCPKKDLMRIVRTPEGTVINDPTGKANGRGAYLKKSLEAVEIAQKKKVLQRALEVDIDPLFFEELKNYVSQ